MRHSEAIATALSPFSNLFEAFHRAGFQLYAVGGCVRDWTMGMVPKDIDFTTDALPEQTREVLQDNGWKVIPVGEVFGTIATIIDKKQYEITTFRVRESYTRGSRHPIVCYGRELEKDLERRDLTINAMAADETGGIYDPFDGLGDIERRILRVPRSSYEQTLSIFGDDPLRILRLARFMARLGFDVDPDATRAATDMAGSIMTVSHERWYSELDGLIRAHEFASAIEWLMQTGILPLILPELQALRWTRSKPVSLSDHEMIATEKSLFEQTLETIGNSPAESDFRWAALFSLFGYTASNHMGWANQTTQMIASEILQRFKFSSARTDKIIRMLRLLPNGEPQYRTAREFAIEQGNALEAWNRFQDVRLSCLNDAEQTASESARLNRWREALSPYIADPSSAEVQLPRSLSAELSNALSVRGKTLGLCIAQCREAVLDEYLSETDDCEKFITWVRDHFDRQ